ncbi:hypothetical protein M8R19_23715 [Pseudomonas sp. R3.Fl]|uniref:hypothetical protein n=1 Tax=Pseudomonas sp. R3.Fl TaxID=2928708 RepID=UPI00201DD107|nr:hypothetical protein [Pseudomonas sp. R3.Fl]MCL6691708.1 hypothetical protein [Pseudomonas sp. R3.Fl]
MRNVQMLAMAIGFTLSVGSVAGEAEFRLSDAGLTYEFKRVPVYDADKRLMYNAGEITVVDSTGTVLALGRNGQSPGCSKFPAISKMSVPLIKAVAREGHDSKEFVVFCGSNDGPHNVVRFYNPAFGFVGALDFNDGPVSFIDKGGVLQAIVQKKQYSKLLNSVVTYPVVSEVTSDGLVVDVRLDASTTASKILSSSGSTEEVKGGEDGITLWKLAAAAVKKDSIGYCKALSEFEDSSKALNASSDVERIISGFNSPKC